MVVEAAVVPEPVVSVVAEVVVAVVTAALTITVRVTSVALLPAASVASYWRV